MTPRGYNTVVTFIMLTVVVPTASFAFGHWLGEQSGADRIANRNAEFQAEVDAASIEHGRIPDVYCANWHDEQQVMPGWDKEASATERVWVRGVCMVEDRVFVLPEVKP